MAGGVTGEAGAGVTGDRLGAARDLGEAPVPVGRRGEGVDGGEREGDVVARPDPAVGACEA